MIRIALHKIQKYYGASHILKGLSFEVFEGEKVGLLGPNGSGKSTALKILTQIEQYDEGDVFITKGVRIGILDQIPLFDSSYSVRDCLYTAFSDLVEQRKTIEKFEDNLKYDSSASLLKKYGDVQLAFELAGGYEIDKKVEEIVGAFNLGNAFLEQPFSQLSGGEKTKINLAIILLQNVDVLLLDEPTNHLDLNTIEWLESYIKTFKGIVVLISHDRYFLNQTVSRIIELIDGQAHFYKGNYDEFSAQKKILLEQQLEKYEQEEKKIQQLDDAAKRMHDWANRADSGAMHRRAFAIEKRIERMDKTEKPKKIVQMKDQFNMAKTHSKETVHLKNISKYYDDLMIADNIDQIIYKYDRIALLGENGVGKSTLFKIILKMEPPTGGEIVLSPSAKIGYLPQEIQFDDWEQSVLEFIKNQLEIEEGPARSLLARYRFRQEEVFKKLKSLSGGEKTRLKLCTLMYEEVNVLFLDEPTNHLDIDSREWVEEAIESFSGTLVFVSHDRHFINKFSKTFWTLEGGEISVFKGTYSEYKRESSIEVKVERIVSEDRPVVKNTLKTVKPNLFKIEQLEESMEKIEQRLMRIEESLYDVGLEYFEIEALLEEKNNLKKEQTKCYESWFKYQDFN